MIDEKDINLLKGVFVTREECGLKTDTVENKLGKDNVRLSVIENQLKTITKLLWLTCSGIIAMLVETMLGKLF